MAAHADTDHRDLDHVGIRLQRDEAENLFLRLERRHRAREIGLGHREGEIGGLAVIRDVLDDHVDIDRVLGERSEDRRSHAGPVRHLAQDHLGFVAAVGDAAHHLLFQNLVLVHDQCTRNILEAR